MGDLWREEITASLARRFRDAATEFAALAVFADVAADRQVAVLAPERLEQPGGRPKSRIERFEDAMFFEDVGRDERQLMNGLSEFRGHASRSNGHEANSGDGSRNLQRAKSLLQVARSKVQGAAHMRNDPRSGSRRFGHKPEMLRRSTKIGPFRERSEVGVDISTRIAIMSPPEPMKSHQNSRIVWPDPDA
jgi:hypothetical protein